MTRARSGPSSANRDFTGLRNDVRTRLFDWTAQSRRVAQEAPADLDTMTHLSRGAAVNTYERHVATVRGADRGERNMLRTIAGEYGALDRATWQTLTGVLAG